jgi:hypothetical protein
MKKGYILVSWFIVILLINCFGWEEKSFIQQHMDLITSAFVGSGIGIFGWLIIGTLGLAGSFGGIAIGLPSFILLGMFSCLGGTSFIHVLRNPSHYNINYLFIVAMLVVGISSYILINIYANRRKNGNQKVLEKSDNQQKRD